MPRTGKSYLMGKLIRQCSRVIVMDTVNQYGNGPRQNPLPGFVEISQPGRLIDYLRKHRFGKFQILYKPGYYAEKHFEAVARIILEVRDVVFAVDEMWHFCKPGWMPEPLRFMVRAGRHRGVTLVYTAQFPANVARDLTAASTDLRVFRLIEPRDLESLKGRLVPEYLARVPKLPDRTHLWRDEVSAVRMIAPNGKTPR